MKRSLDTAGTFQAFGLWDKGPTHYAPKYNTYMNRVIIQVTALEPPILFKERLSYLSYGALGSIASHEMTVRRSGFIINTV